MKTLIASLLLMAGLGISAQAQQTPLMTNASAVKSVVPYNTACKAMAISSGTAVDVTLGNVSSPSSSTAGIYNIFVENLDTVADICCITNNASVSCTASNANAGIPLIHQVSSTTPPNFLSIGIATWEPFHCIANGVMSNLAIVCRWR